MTEVVSARGKKWKHEERDSFWRTQKVTSIIRSPPCLLGDREGEKRWGPTRRAALDHIFPGGVTPVLTSSWEGKEGKYKGKGRVFYSECCRDDSNKEGTITIQNSAVSERGPGTLLGERGQNKKKEDTTCGEGWSYLPRERPGEYEVTRRGGHFHRFEKKRACPFITRGGGGEKKDLLWPGEEILYFLERSIPGQLRRNLRKKGFDVVPPPPPKKPDMVAWRRGKEEGGLPRRKRLIDDKGGLRFFPAEGAGARSRWKETREKAGRERRAGAVPHGVSQRV